MDKKKFIADVSTLLLGNVGGQLVLIATLPVVTRLYSPAEFGAVQTIESIAQITMAVGALCYERAFVAAKCTRERNELLIISVSLSLIISLVGMCVAIRFFPTDAVNGATNLNLLYILLLPIFIGRNLFWVLSAYTSSLGKFSITAKTVFVRSFGLAFSRIFLGLLGGGFVSLLVSSLVGSVLGVSMLAQKAKVGWQEQLKNINFSSLKQVGKKYLHYPMFEGVGLFCSELADRLPVVFLGYVFGYAAAGQYAIALLIVVRPVGIFVRSISIVLRTFVGEQWKTDAQKSEILPLKVLFLIWLVSFLVLVTIALVAPFVFPIIFGEKWAVGGLIVAALAPRVLIVMMIRPVLGSLSAIQKVRPVLFSQVGMLACTLLPLYVGPYLLNFDLLHTVIFMSCSVLFFGSFILVYAVRKVYI